MHKVSKKLFKELYGSEKLLLLGSLRISVEAMQAKTLALPIEAIRKSGIPVTHVDLLSDSKQQVTTTVYTFPYEDVKLFVVHTYYATAEKAYQNECILYKEV